MTPPNESRPCPISGLRAIYVTAQAPWGKGETFVLTEALEMARYCSLLVVPLKPGKQIMHDEGSEVSKFALRVPLICSQTIIALLQLMVESPRRILGLVLAFLKHSRSIRLAFKNLAVLPKVAWMTLQLEQGNLPHIHCHWASTPSSFGYGVSRLSSAPWSLTAHRWDIEEDNMIAEKVRTADFIRVISERGRREVLKRIPAELTHKVVVIPMGVRLPVDVPAIAIQDSRPPTVACIANLVAVKGHRTFLEACKILRSRGISFKCLIVGQGPLQTKLATAAKALNLEECVRFAGLVSHRKVMSMLAEQQIQVCVQPSIRTTDGQEEGIPVSLMEAMACGIPVVATRTGAIGELVTDKRCGILVPPGDAEALAQAIESLLVDPHWRQELGRNGREIVRANFNIERNAARLRETMGLDLPR